MTRSPRRGAGILEAFKMGKNSNFYLRQTWTSKCEVAAILQEQKASHRKKNNDKLVASVKSIPQMFRVVFSPHIGPGRP